MKVGFISLGCAKNQVISKIQLRDHVLQSASVSPLTFRDSLTGRFRILFPSQLLQYTKLL